MGMRSNSTINDIIESNVNIMNNSNYHFKTVVTNSKGEMFVVNMNAIFEKYYSFMLDNSAEISMTDNEYHKYKYNPKLLSKDLYGTYEFHFLLLRVNNMVSKIEFNKKDITVFKPEIVKLLNEMLIKESEAIIDNDMAVIKVLRGI